MLDDQTDSGRQRGASRGGGVSPATAVERSEIGGSEAAGPHPLGTSRNLLPPLSARALDDQQDWRRTRYRRRQESAEILTAWARAEEGLDPADMTARACDEGWVRPPRPARCRWAVGSTVGVHHGDTGAHWTGVERCGSIWACPVCASVIRHKRANDVQQAVESWQAQGGSVVFVTLTVRHGVEDDLAMTLDAVMSGWRRLLQGKAWQRFRARFGIRGQIRAIETTVSAEAGWHPHCHALFFVDQPLSDADLVEWERSMFERWARYVVDLGARLPTRLRGIDVRAADSHGRVVAQYLTKLQDAAKAPRHKIGDELARADYKAGRAASLAPFELLDAAHAEDEIDDAARSQLWVEYYLATRGRQAITWSKGLRDLTMPDADEELTDEEILDETDADPVVLLIPRDAYRRRLQQQPEVAAAVLDAVERGSLAVALALSGGHLTGADLLDSA